MQKLAKILGVEPAVLERLDRDMSAITGKAGIIEKVAKENEYIVDSSLTILDSANRSAAHVKSVLRKRIISHEQELFNFLATVKGESEFAKAANLAREIAKVGKGFFLKKERAKEILHKRPPENVLKYFGFDNVYDLLSRHDVTEIFVSLRFMESEEWMHKTFDEVYNNFTADDFEERDIEIKVLGAAWREVAKRFVAKKHHNVSHLKEFGVIFLNPIKENIPGKFLRDCALILHYFHEIEFYSKLFRKYSAEENFAEKFKMLLRGDVKEIYKAEKGEWLIVQRYLWKENPNDPRLFVPRVNPESIHWARGERDMAAFALQNGSIELRLWSDLDWVGGLFQDGGEEVISFDLEDNAMSLVSFMEGKEEFFNYHQKEALWTKIFAEYAGGEENMEKLLLENFDKGVIKF